ncbi:MAG: hypothetical protein A2X79_05040 [Desulfuromonadaceae bacterium GWB2_53_15]|nr:MAG: hypothetical protein A2X79_05040 [Desulfuromonadaceae bacterium GWB2_53_15]
MANKGKSLSRSIGLLLASSLVLTLFQVVSCLGAQQPLPLETMPGERLDAALAGTTKDDLLLFWEEKDLYVETATRAEKPLTQVAENMTVITARDIHDMNARSVSEVLNRVPGLFIDFNGMDFSGTSLPHIQGSESRHVRVLLDGVTWNSLGSGEVDTFTIPVQSIERIEIVKGPASSAWGSALGGVINIITKGTGDTTIPKGMVSASYGEANSQNYRAELYGKGGAAGYYLYAGRQDSDGLRKSRAFWQNNLYAKASVAPTRDLDLVFSTGYSNPHINSGATPEFNLRSGSNLTTFFATGALDYRISTELSLKGSAHLFRQKVDQRFNFITPNELLRKVVFDEKSGGGNLRLVYAAGMHTAVLGMDASHGILDQTLLAGPFYQSAGQPASSSVSPGIDKWALFANDTIELGKLAITTGFRLDHDNITGYFASPSIGAAYELGEYTVARATVARGFNSPGIGITSGGGIFLLANPALKTEYGWSYQAGLESGIADAVQVKGSLFRHDTTNEIFLDATNRFAKIYRNGGDITRQGYELEAESVPLYHLTLKLGHAYVHKSADSASEGIDNYSYMVAIKYDDRTSFMAQLMGNYVWWNLPAVQGAKYDTFIWDLALNKKIFTTDNTETEIFANVHNIFGGAYYTLNVQPNPGRWVEGGLRFRF